MLPAGTIAKLAASHPEGTRHQAKVELAMEMLGNGLSENAVEVTLLEKFPSAAPKEILNVLRWACAHDPQPSAHACANFNPSQRNGFFHRDPPASRAQAEAQCRRARVPGVAGRAYVCARRIFTRKARSSPTTAILRVMRSWSWRTSTARPIA